jgi:hypothetical protein
MALATCFYTIHLSHDALDMESVELTDKADVLL